MSMSSAMLLVMFDKWRQEGYDHKGNNSPFGCPDFSNFIVQTSKLIREGYLTHIPLPKKADGTRDHEWRITEKGVLLAQLIVIEIQTVEKQMRQIKPKTETKTLKSKN